LEKERTGRMTVEEEENREDFLVAEGENREDD
jgi:hypothetical protein